MSEIVKISGVENTLEVEKISQEEKLFENIIG